MWWEPGVRCTTHGLYCPIHLGAISENTTHAYAKDTVPLVYGEGLWILSSEASIHCSLCWVMFFHQGLMTAPDSLVCKYPDLLVLKFLDLPACFTDPSVVKLLDPTACFTNYFALDFLDMLKPFLTLIRAPSCAEALQLQMHCLYIL